MNQHIIMIKRHRYAPVVDRWEPMVEWDGKPVVCQSPSEAREYCMALNNGPYELSHNEHSRPSYGYTPTNGCRVREVTP